MSKIYYLTDLDIKNTYKPICELIRKTYTSNIESLLLESDIQYKCEYKDGMMFSIDERFKCEFEEILKELFVNYEIVSVKNDEAIQNLEEKVMIYPYKKLKNGKIAIKEVLVARKDGIKMYVKSKEKGCHYYPHVHFDYQNSENSLVVYIHNYEKRINKINDSKKEKECINILKKNINAAKEAWNKSDAPIKFKVDSDGNITNEMYNSEDGSCQR